MGYVPEVVTLLPSLREQDTARWEPGLNTQGDTVLVCRCKDTGAVEGLGLPQLPLLGDELFAP